MKYPTTKFVFDRKKKATKEIKSLVQIEVYYNLKRKYISTGVYVCINQWDAARQRIKGSLNAVTLNARLDAIKENIDKYILGLIDEKAPFSWESFENYLIEIERGKETFIEFIARRINERQDIRESTRKTQKKLISALNEFGRIIEFRDLTTPNIKRYNDFLHSKGNKQTNNNL